MRPCSLKGSRNLTLFSFYSEANGSKDNGGLIVCKRRALETALEWPAFCNNEEKVPLPTSFLVNVSEEKKKKKEPTAFCSSGEKEQAALCPHWFSSSSRFIQLV